MKRLSLLVLLAAAACAAAIVTPDSFGGPYCLSPAFGTAACAITDQYSAGGVVFSNGTGTATFNDFPDAWGGISGLNTVDLLSPVQGFLVVLGSTTSGLTSSLSVEAGFSDPGDLLLEVFDAGNSLIASRVNGLDGLGPNGRSLITLSVPGIHSFSVSSPVGDVFGVDQIELGAISSVPVAGVPEPGSAWFIAIGLLGLLARRLRRPA